MDFPAETWSPSPAPSNEKFPVEEVEVYEEGQWKYVSQGTGSEMPRYLWLLSGYVWWDARDPASQN
ncbi:MAG: hypothetical protein H0T73_13950 [Ardenticatenales bacterium]|nr:hypothetical protein [Ardenticatenales bacterium]